MEIKNEDIINLLVDKLRENRESLSQDFFKVSSSTDTKFFILDNLLPEDLAVNIFKYFPKKSMWNYTDTFREKKYTFAKLDKLKNALPEQVTDCLQSKPVIEEIKEITLIPDLEGDPSLYAGGLSRMEESHFLNPHIDNSHDANRTRYRRLNLLYYVSPGIKEEDGGNFELWDSQVKIPLKLPSKFNRLVVMETNTHSWHSVDMVQSEVARCCLSNYYFTRSSPTGGHYYHVTSFTGRPSQAFRRLYGKIDNFLRQKVATVLGLSRGKDLSR
ncbi:MAG: 2OG-Fe(II) oxygenase [Candidatus Pelagibacter sp.]|nr:2OG-Fe(II) oxygenase [Candidatus Pelagibacter sp.]|tara:strand:+ start:1623 stop:2438 length:816 start_codon:yes stop_codon:yes gene_type:complete